MTVIPREESCAQVERPRIRLSHLIAFFIFFAFVGGLAVVASGFYLTHWRHGLAREVSHWLPLPAVSVEGDMVWYRDVVEIAAVLEQSNREGIFSDPWDHALQIAIERKHTKHLVRELDSFVGQAEVASYPIDEEDLTDFLQDVGWTVDDYRHYIVQPLLLSQKAEKAVYASDLYQRNARNRIEMIQEKIELGVSFTDLAKQHSEDLSASFGGDIGYVTADELDQGLESIFDLEAGKISDILEGPTYFAIVYVYDLVEIDEEEVQAGIQIITVNKDGLAEALVDYSADKKVVFFVR